MLCFNNANQFKKPKLQLCDVESSSITMSKVQNFPWRKMKSKYLLTKKTSSEQSHILARLDVL